MDKRKVVLTFLKNFFIAGFTIGLYSIIMEFYSPQVVGFIHGALPITFTYLVFLTWVKHRNKLNKNALRKRYFGIPLDRFCFPALWFGGLWIFATCLLRNHVGRFCGGMCFIL